MVIVFTPATGASLKSELRHPVLEAARDGGPDFARNFAIFGWAVAVLGVRAADGDQDAPGLDAVAGCEYVDDRIRLLEVDPPRSHATGIES